MQLRKVLKDVMKTKGHNTRTLAESTGVAEGTLKTWLAGSNPRCLDDLRTVARHLGVSFEYLVFGNESEPSENHLKMDSDLHTFEGWLKIKIEKICPEPFLEINNETRDKKSN